MLNPFAGQWRGLEILTSDGFEVSAKSLTIGVFPSGEGFKLQWVTPHGDNENALFLATEKSGVFSESPSKRSIFGSSKEADLLAGDPLRWVRIEGDSFILYALTIDKRGAFTLDRYHAALKQNLLQLVFNRRSHGATERSLTARLGRGKDR